MISPNLAAWVEMAGDYAPSAPLAEELQVDVAVIGAGITGLSAACQLSRDGSLSVAVVEQATVGAASSGRNGGTLTPGLGFTASVVKRFYGDSRLRELLAYTNHSLECTRELIRSEKLDSDHHPGIPHVKIALTKEFVPQLEAGLEFALEYGVADTYEWWDEQRLKDQFSSPLMQGAAALYNRREDGINPVKHVRELKRLAIARGAAVFEHSPVIDIARSNGRYRVVAPGGALLADKLVIATNAYTHQLPGGIVPARDQWPLYAYKIATEPLSDQTWAELGWEPDLGVSDTLTPWHSMRRIRSGQMTFSGGHYPIADRALQHEYREDAFAGLAREFRSFHPSLGDVRISHKWGGTLSMTFDLIPHIGYVDKERQVVRISGCWGHGLATAYLNGEVADQLVREQSGGWADHWIVNRKPRSWPPGPVRYVGMTAVMSRLKAASMKTLRAATEIEPEPRRTALRALHT